MARITKEMILDIYKFKDEQRIKLISTSDPHTNLKPGDKGTFKGLDDMGHIMINWDNGSSLSMIHGEDQIKLIDYMGLGNSVKVTHKQDTQFFNKIGIIVKKDDFEFVKVKFENETKNMNIHGLLDLSL
jgi:hypothetical protein